MSEVGRQLVHFARSIMSGAIPACDRPDGKSVPKIVDARWPSGHGLGPCTPHADALTDTNKVCPRPAIIGSFAFAIHEERFRVSFEQSIPFGTVVLQSHRDIRIDWKDSFLAILAVLYVEQLPLGIEVCRV